MPAKMFNPGARKAKPAPKQSMGKPARAVPMSGKPVFVGKPKNAPSSGSGPRPIPPVLRTMPVGPKPRPGGPGGPPRGKPLGPGSSNVEKGRISMSGPVIRMGGKPSISIASKR